MICPNCNTVWPDELKAVLKFCGACGKPLDAAAPAPPAPPIPEPAPGGVGSPGGELRFVTVVFADLAGFTAFAEDRAPDEVAQIVGDLLQRLGKVVEDNGGAVDKFLGDAVVATFGLPRPDPNAARNAVRAGLEMQACAARFNQEVGLNFGLRVGIHAGEVMFRAIGGNWTVMGDTVNTASRIQSVATPGRVWISRPVYEEVRRFFALQARPAIELKGKKHSVQPYEVIEERRTPYINLPPFVGREAEWKRLLASLQEALDYQTLRVIVLRGPAGVGKSRLAWELRDWIQRQEAIYRVNVVQFDDAERLPSHGLNSIIRSRFDLPVGLPDDEILQRLAERLPGENPAAAERAALAVEFLAFALGISRPEFRTAQMDGKSRWEGAFFEIKSWLERQALEEPWVLFLEDAQKGDADTAAFVDWALRVEWRAPVVLVVTIREEDFGPQTYWYGPLQRWLKGAGGRVEEFRLKEIATEALADALVRMMDGSVSPDLARRIAEHTEGNPLFAIEITLLLKEREQAGEAIDTVKLALPGSIREVMEARIERLGQEGKEVAKRGSLIGRRFTREAVERIWERPPYEMETGYTILRETETIYEEPSRLFVGVQEDVFRHGRLQEAVLARVPRDERQGWLKALEAWALDKLEEELNYVAAVTMLIPLIARSREEQHDAWQTSLWYEVLGLLHLKLHRTKDAIQAFRRACLDCDGVRGLVIARLTAEAEAFDGAGEHALLTIEHAAAAQVGEESTRVDVRADVPALVEKLLLSQMGDVLGNWRVLNEAQAATAMELTRARTLTNLGRVSEARQAFEAVEGRLDGLSGEAGQRLRLRWARDWIYLLSEILGRHLEAEAVCQQMRRRADLQTPDLRDEWGAYLTSEALVASHLGRYARAQAIYDERMQIATETNNLRDQAHIWNNKGTVSHAQGDMAGAVDCYLRSRDLSRVIGNRRGEVIALHNLAEVHLDQDQLDEAARFEEQYLALSRLSGNHMAEAYAPLLRSALAQARGEYAEAEALIRAALVTAETNGWSSLVTMMHVSLAELDLERWLEARDAPALERAVEVLARSEQEQPEELAPIDYAMVVLALFYSGQSEQAAAVYERFKQIEDESWVVDCYWLELAWRVLQGLSCGEIAEKFAQKGYRRAARFVEMVG